MIRHALTPDISLVICVQQGRALVNLGVDEKHAERLATLMMLEVLFPDAGVCVCACACSRFLMWARSCSLGLDKFCKGNSFAH